MAVVLNITSCYAIYCYSTCGRKVPNNYICLSIFTLTEAYIFSSFTSFLDPDIVFIAATLTAAMTISLTIYAMKTETDLTYCGAFLFMAFCMLFVGSFLAFFFAGQLVNILISIFTVILFGLYIVYDTQLICGNHALKLSTDDYIIGALHLYIDIMRIFLEILKILAELKK